MEQELTLIVIVWITAETNTLCLSFIWRFLDVFQGYPRGFPNKDCTALYDIAWVLSKQRKKTDTKNIDKQHKMYLCDFPFFPWLAFETDKSFRDLKSDSQRDYLGEPFYLQTPEPSFPAVYITNFFHIAPN